MAPTKMTSSRHLNISKTVSTKKNIEAVAEYTENVDLKVQINLNTVGQLKNRKSASALKRPVEFSKENEFKTS